MRCVLAGEQTARPAIITRVWNSNPGEAVANIRVFVEDGPDVFLSGVKEVVPEAMTSHDDAAVPTNLSPGTPAWWWPTRT